jgi:hypothetical protein
MASVVGVWLGEFAKFSRPEAVHQGSGVGAGAAPCRPAEEGVVGAETGKKAVVVQEKPMRASGVLSDPEAVACLLMDRFAPASHKAEQRSRG